MLCKVPLDVRFSVGRIACRVVDAEKVPSVVKRVLYTQIPGQALTCASKLNGKIKFGNRGT